MPLSNLNVNYGDDTLRSIVQNRVATQIPVISAYNEARNSQIRSEENAELWNAFLRNRDLSNVNGPRPDRITDGGGDGNPTLGYGFNLARNDLAADEIDDLIRHVFGTLTTEQELAVDLLIAWKGENPYTFTDDRGTPDDLSDDVDVTITMINADIIDGAQGASVADAVRHANLTLTARQSLDHVLSSLQSLTLNETQADTLLNADLNGLDGVITSREDRLNTAIGGADVLPDSIERAVVMSLFFNAETLVGPGLRAALDAGNRALAWWEIRYNHTNVELQSRRDREADIFRLISREGEENADLQEYKTAVSFLFNGTSLGPSPSDLYETTVERLGLTKFFNDIADELSVLQNAYTIPFAGGDAVSVDIVQQGTGEFDEITAKSSLADGKDETNTNNLIFGEDGGDIIYGLGGSDFLYGGAGNDILSGGRGSDLIHGGDEAIGLAIADDGADLANYGDAGDGASGIMVSVHPSSLAGQIVYSVIDPYGDTDTLISIEGFIGTRHNDVFDFSTFPPSRRAALRYANIFSVGRTFTCGARSVRQVLFH